VRRLAGREIVPWIVLGRMLTKLTPWLLALGLAGCGAPAQGEPGPPGARADDPAAAPAAGASRPSRRPRPRTARPRAAGGAQHGWRGPLLDDTRWLGPIRYEIEGGLGCK
jgi:hypothetical protein